MSVRGLVGRGYALGQKFLHQKLEFVLKLCHVKEFFENLISFYRYRLEWLKNYFLAKNPKKSFLLSFRWAFRKTYF